MVVRLVFGEYETKHFDPLLLDHIHYREDAEAIELISNAADDYKITHLRDRKGLTLLHHAVKEGNEVVTKYLLKLGFNVDALDCEGRTPLIFAVKVNHVTITEMLLGANSNIYVEIDKHRTLVESIFDGKIPCYSQIIDMFLNRLISEHATDKLKAKALLETRCPLFYVLGLNNPVITKIMLEKGCDVNKQEYKYGNAPLHRAVFFNDLETIKLLLDYGANVNAKDKGGKIAWRCSPIHNGSFVQLKVLQILLEQKPVLKSLRVDGRFQMYELFVRGGDAPVKMILRSGIDLSGKDGKGDTIFHYLALNEKLSGAKLLSDKNNSVDTKNNGRLTALHVAAKNGVIGAMMFLLNNGAQVDAKTGDRGLSPLLCAVRSTTNSKKNETVELLLERGADAQWITPKNVTALDITKESNDTVEKTVLAHLAMIESCGKAIVPYIRTKIDKCEKFKKQYGLFKKQLEVMKKEKVEESVTLFELLVEDKKKIEEKVKSKGLKMKFKNHNNNDYNFHPYYNNRLRKRVNQALKMIELFE